MARLKMVAPQLRNIAPAVKIAASTAVGGSWQRDNAEDRAFLKTAAWQRLRWSVLQRDGFTCQWPGCGRVLAHRPSELVADHRVPVRVAPERTWDETNLQCLCAACHSGPKQAWEVAVYGPGGAATGGR
jgi:5-methylcytosine-specific restriction protein A